MLSESHLNPVVKRQLRTERFAQPVNRATYLGNDQTGMSAHYQNIASSTTPILPVARRANKDTGYHVWNYLPAIEHLRNGVFRMSDLVKPERREDFKLIYCQLRKMGYDRKAIMNFIRQYATAE